MKNNLSIILLIILWLGIFSMLGWFVYDIVKYDHEKAYHDCSYKWELRLDGVTPYSESHAISKPYSTLEVPSEILAVCRDVLIEEKRQEHEARFNSISDLLDYAGIPN